MHWALCLVLAGSSAAGVSSCNFTCCSETQGSCYDLSQLRIWPTEGERSHHKGSSFAKEPSSLPSGFAAQGAGTLIEGVEGKTPLSPYMDVQPCTKVGWGHKSLREIFSYLEGLIFALDIAMHFSVYKSAASPRLQFIHWHE